MSDVYVDALVERAETLRASQRSFFGGSAPPAEAMLELATIAIALLAEIVRELRAQRTRSPKGPRP